MSQQRIPLQLLAASLLLTATCGAARSPHCSATLASAGFDADMAGPESTTLFPNGSYVDMCSKLPVVDPAGMQAPTLLLRGEFDGIASYADVAGFFERLPRMDKHLSILRGVGYGGLQSRKDRVVSHLLLAFFSQPEPR